jgi:hypothetical protein
MVVMNPQFLRTSKSGRSLREARDFPLAICLRRACGLRCPFPQKTNGSGVPPRRRAGCNGSETIGIDRRFGVLEAQLIDNLNASIHLRALLTDSFLLSDIFRLNVRASAASVRT